MKSKFLLPCLFALLSLPARATEYTIDPSHTYASFEIDHLGFSTQRGRFNRTGGSIELNLEERTGSATIRIDATSVDTGFEARDIALQGEEWFNTKAYPNIFFRGARLIFEGDKPVAVEGRLTLLAETRPFRLEITNYKCGFNMAIRKRACGADAQGNVRRSDFGMKVGIPFIGDEVRLHIQVEAVGI